MNRQKGLFAELGEWRRKIELLIIHACPLKCLKDPLNLVFLAFAPAREKIA